MRITVNIRGRHRGAWHPPPFFHNMKASFVPYRLTNSNNFASLYLVCFPPFSPLFYTIFHPKLAHLSPPLRDAPLVIYRRMETKQCYVHQKCKKTTSFVEFCPNSGVFCKTAMFSCSTIHCLKRNVSQFLRIMFGVLPIRPKALSWFVI